MKQYDINKINQLVADGLIIKQVHPTLPLSIYKYTVETQARKLWDDITSRCRGLVLDDQGYAYSNPIPKFHNIEELDPSQIPTNLEYEVTDKIDGSCIEVFWYYDHLIVCTLGSFTSDQAKLADQMIQSMGVQNVFLSGHTHIFELVSPKNRIVLDYGNYESLVLLTIRNNETDLDITPTSFPPFPIVEVLHKTLDEILLDKKRADFTNKEGFVVKFTNGFRVKVKYEEYFRLHKIMTGVSEHKVWEYMKDGMALPLENVPDEFFQYVTDAQKKLQTEYNSLERHAQRAFTELYSPTQSRKDFALNVLAEYTTLRGILFKMYENKDYSSLIWKIIEPASEVKHFNSFRGVS